MQSAGSQFLTGHENPAQNRKGVPCLMQGENTLVIIQLK